MPMASLIANRHGLGTSFSDLLSCFYSRSTEVEETFMVPFARHDAGSSWEISYSIRYPEIKDTEDGPEWCQRQSAILHRFNHATSQSVIVLISPNPNATAWEAMVKHLDAHPSGGLPNPLWPHQILLSTHIPAWRKYITSIEAEVLPIVSRFLSCLVDSKEYTQRLQTGIVFTTELNEPLRVQYQSLRTLVSCEVRCAKATTVLELTRNVLNQLVLFLNDNAPDRISELIPQIRNHQSQCDTYTTTAGFIRQRAQTSAQLLSDTLSFHDQIISNEQNANMFRLNKSAVFITTLTLVYLPASFVAVSRYSFQLPSYRGPADSYFRRFSG